MCKECKEKDCIYFMWDCADWWIWSCMLELPVVEFR